MAQVEGSSHIMLPVRPFTTRKPERQALGLTNRRHQRLSVDPPQKKPSLDPSSINAQIPSIRRVSSKGVAQPAQAVSKEPSNICPKDFRLDLDKVFADVHAEYNLFPVRAANVGIRALTQRYERKEQVKKEGLKTERLERTFEKLAERQPESLHSKLLARSQHESQLFKDTHFSWDCKDAAERFTTSRAWNLHDSQHTRPSLPFSENLKREKFARIQDNRITVAQRARENDVKAETQRKSRIESKRLQKHDYLRRVAEKSGRAARSTKQCRCSACHKVVRLKRA